MKYKLTIVKNGVNNDFFMTKQDAGAVALMAIKEMQMGTSGTFENSLHCEFEPEAWFRFQSSQPFSKSLKLASSLSPFKNISIKGKI